MGLQRGWGDSGGRPENGHRKEWYDLAGSGEEAGGVSSCE